MRVAVALPIIILGLVVLCLAVGGAILWTTLSKLDLPAETVQITILLSAAAAAGLLLAGALSWITLHLRFVKPMESLGREVETLTRLPKGRSLNLAEGNWLGELPRQVDGLLSAFERSRGETEQTVSRATNRIEEQKSRLEAILFDMSEGVIVCNLEHRILLYNESAVRVISEPQKLGLGRDLFLVLAREPVLHSLEQLMRPDDSSEPNRDKRAIRRFVCAVSDSDALLEARMSLVTDPQGEPSGYVLTFTDIGADLENLASRDGLLREVAFRWRAPVANLRAAIEMLTSTEDMPAKDRAAFLGVLAEEIDTLNEGLMSLTRRYERLAAGQWPMQDVYSTDLFQVIATHLGQTKGIKVTLIGVPLWLHADSHSLMLTIEHLIVKVHEFSGRRNFDIEPLLGDRHVYIEIVWEGDPVHSKLLEEWLDEPLPGTIGGRSAREIVEHHGAELWSKVQRPGFACIRIPLRAPKRQQFAEVEGRFPPRPEFYDFDLFRKRVHDQALEDTPLAELRYVVFDTETTGLRPSEGDEMLSIGAVRITNGRILTGETFERLINPGRNIPSQSVKFHGITAEMVRDMPPAAIVLPQFRAFVGKTVLVAHNAAFDMKFLQLKEATTGIVFDTPVLDVLLLSAYLHDHTTDHSLNAIAERMGVEISNRHSALGDAMTTAGIFVRMLELMEERGLRTFGDALRVSSQMVEIRKQQAEF